MRNLPKTPLVITLGRLVALLLSLLVILNIFLSPVGATHSSAYLYVYVLDVGQSDAILLTTSGKTMLIDSGTSMERDALEKELLRYGIEKIDILLLTHPHEDHIGNARYLIETLEVERLLLPDVADEDLGYRILLDSAADIQETVVAGDTFSLGYATFEVLFSGGVLSEENPNNGSVVLRGVFGKQVFLFMGDAEREVEAALLATYEERYLDCDFLKVGHHGSDTATTMDFVLATTPTVAVISCGEDNTYGFPHDTVIENLTALQAHIFRTDEDGTVVIGTNGKEMRKIPRRTKGLGQ